MIEPKIERLQHGISREWYPAETPYCILRTPEVLDRAGLDYWTLVLTVTVKLFKPDQPMRIVYDLSMRGRVIPLYIALVHQAVAGRRGYQAFVLPDELVGRVLVAIRDSYQQDRADKNLQDIEERLFTSEADAVNWLLNVN